jgi:hypothetical protein
MCPRHGPGFLGSRRELDLKADSRPGSGRKSGPVIYSLNAQSEIAPTTLLLCEPALRTDSYGQPRAGWNLGQQ